MKNENNPFPISLLDFIKNTHYQRFNTEFICNSHHSIICDAFEKVVLGETKRLIINLPPRYSKTTLAIKNFIAWSMGLYPDSDFIHASYSKKLATNNSVNCHELVLSEAYRQFFPHTHLLNDSERGRIYPIGVGGALTGCAAGKTSPGFGGCILIDDPYQPGKHYDKAMLQNVIDWFQNDIETHICSPETPIVLIMSRFHENDLSGFLLNGGNGEHFEHLCFPVLDENNNPLWEAKHTLADLKLMQERNYLIFASQYMQSPISA